MPLLRNVLRKSTPPVEGQEGKHPDPPSWVRTHMLGAVGRKAPTKPGVVELNLHVVPWDLLRARGDDFDTPTLHKDVLTTYSLMGGLDGSFDNPRTLRPFPVKVNRQGALHTISSGLRTKTAYEGNVDNTGDVTIVLSPAPSKCLLIANDGGASFTVKETGFYQSDSSTPDFRGITAATYPAGFVNTEQVEMVGLLLHTASAAPIAYRVWSYT